MTTSEQIANYRKEFEKTEWSTELKRNPSGYYANNYIEGVWQGYLRRCQETEQAIKDARKQALEEAYTIYEQAQELSHVKDGLRELLK